MCFRDMPTLCNDLPKVVLTEPQSRLVQTLAYLSKEQNDLAGHIRKVIMKMTNCGLLRCSAQSEVDKKGFSSRLALRQGISPAKVLFSCSIKKPEVILIVHLKNRICHPSISDKHTRYLSVLG